MTGLRFRETMTGRIAARCADPVQGYRAANAVATSMHVEIDIADVDAFVAAERHAALMRAEFVIPVLGGRFVSDDGEFTCFWPGDGPGGRQVQQLIYTATLINDDRVYRMSARKILEPKGFRVWRDTTTLYVRFDDVTADADTERPRRHAGIVRITPGAFAKQLTTMRPHGSDSAGSRLRALFRYLAFFVGGLVKTYVLRDRR
jgi:hypothetical protein